MHVNTWPAKRKNLQDKTSIRKTDDPGTEQNDGCFVQVQSEPILSAAKHPDDSQEIFSEEIYSEEEFACRVAIDGPEFLDTT